MVANGAQVEVELLLAVRNNSRKVQIKVLEAIRIIFAVGYCSWRLIQEKFSFIPDIC
jgi:hypothetical protein